MSLNSWLDFGGRYEIGTGKEQGKQAPTFLQSFHTRSSAIAEGPRDASCELKSCQLPRNSAETTCTTSPKQIVVMKLEGCGGKMCNKHVSNFFGTRKLESPSYRVVLFV